MLAWSSLVDHTTLTRVTKRRYDCITLKKNIIKKFVSSMFLEILSPVNLYLTSSEVESATRQAVRE